MLEGQTRSADVYAATDGLMAAPTPRPISYTSKTARLQKFTGHGHVIRKLRQTMKRNAAKQQANDSNGTKSPKPQPRPPKRRL